MRYVVHGAHQQSGQEANFVIEAATAAHAEARANEMGFLVHSVLQQPVHVAPQTDIERLASAVRSGPPIVVRPAKQVQTIEKTGKEWKAVILLGGVMMIAGLVVFALTIASDARPSGPNVGAIAGLVAFIVGLVVYGIGRVGAWWYHG